MKNFTDLVPWLLGAATGMTTVAVLTHLWGDTVAAVVIAGGTYIILGVLAVISWKDSDV